MLHRLAPVITGIKSGLRRHALEAEDGQGLVEYALILVLISIVVIVILGVVGHQVNNVFSNISNGLKH